MGMRDILKGKLPDKGARHQNPDHYERGNGEASRSCVPIRLLY